MPKGPKKDPNAPTLIAEDTFVRAKKLVELKIAPKQPKGEFTEEEWCIPPAFHSLPELKTCIQFWKQCAIVHYQERSMKAPSRMKVIDDDNKSEKKHHPRKEIQDLLKPVKAMVKGATKRTGQFLKQMAKKEKKEEKRLKLVGQIADVEKAMNDELRNSRKFIDKQQLFDKRYMLGTKLGDAAPRKNALILVEQSDKQAAWVDETKDEVNKMLNEVINPGECESFNIALFSTSAVTPWLPQYQPKADPKKGLADAQKWLNKQFNPKTCGAQPFPPDWSAALNKFTGEGQAPPWRIYLCCSRSPESSGPEALGLIKDLRANMGEPAKGQPVLPINVVAFDPSLVGDDEEKTFFEEVAGESGSFMIDTSAEDLVALDKMLKAVAVKKKQLDKLHKKLDKLEDLSERVLEDRALLQVQIALQQMLMSDFEIIDWALKNETQAPPPEI